MRMASMQYVNGIHAICEWKLCNMRIALIPFARGMLSLLENEYHLELDMQDGFNPALIKDKVLEYINRFEYLNKNEG